MSLRALTLLSTKIDEVIPDDLKNTQLGPLIKEAHAKRRQEELAKAADEALVLAKKVEDVKAGHRKRIKDLRSQMEYETKALNQLDRCIAYAEETSNYLPLLQKVALTDYRVPSEIGYDEFQKLSEVPKDWQPKSDTKP